MKLSDCHIFGLLRDNMIPSKKRKRKQNQSFHFFSHIKAFPLIEVNICFRWFHHNYDLVGPRHRLDLRKRPQPQPFFKYKQNISNTFKYLAIEHNIQAGRNISEIFYDKLNILFYCKWLRFLPGNMVGMFYLIHHRYTGLPDTTNHEGHG